MIISTSTCISPSPYCLCSFQKVLLSLFTNFQLFQYINICFVFFFQITELTVSLTYSLLFLHIFLILSTPHSAYIHTHFSFSHQFRFLLPNNYFFKFHVFSFTFPLSFFSSVLFLISNDRINLFQWLLLLGFSFFFSFFFSVIVIYHL